MNRILPAVVIITLKSPILRRFLLVDEEPPVALVEIRILGSEPEVDIHLGLVRMGHDPSLVVRIVLISPRLLQRIIFENRGKLGAKLLRKKRKKNSKGRRSGHLTDGNGRVVWYWR